MHHRDVVRHLRHHPKVVRDQKHGTTQLALQGFDESEYLGLNRHIERRRRLVCNQQLRFAHQRHRDDDPLPHPAREFMRVLVITNGRQRHSDLSEHFNRQLPRFFERSFLMQQNRFGDLTAHRVHRGQSRHRLLENHAHEPAPHSI